MATYPSISFAVGTDITSESGIEIDRATNGAARGRSLYSSDKREFKLSHKYLSASARATLDAFYAANKTSEFSLVFDGVTYTCIFSDAPQYEYTGSNLAHATVGVVEV